MSDAPRYPFPRKDFALLVACYLISAVSLVALSLSPACGAGDGDRSVATALDVYADVIDPAYALVRAGCADVEHAAVAAEKGGHATPAQTDALIAHNRTRCDALTETFEAMRMTHVRAAEAFEAGELERARDALRALRELWLGFVPDGGAP